jgi:hypothetical protein
MISAGFEYITQCPNPALPVGGENKIYEQKMKFRI